MARPEKTDEDKRELVIRLRVSTSEKSRIWQLAKDAGLTPSDYLRGLSLGTNPTRNVPTQDREILLKILAELNKVGSNHNQIARSLNRRQDSEDLSGISFKAMNLAFDDISNLTSQLMELLK